MMIFPLIVLSYLIIWLRKKLTHLTEWIFTREDTLYLACNELRAFFTSEKHKIIIYGHTKKFAKLLFTFWII